MIIYCNKCGHSCGTMYSILDDPKKYADKNHKCKKPPSLEEQKRLSKMDYPSWINVKKNVKKS